MQIAKGVPAAAATVASIADELTDHDLEAVVGGLARPLVDEVALTAMHAASVPTQRLALGQTDVHLEPSPA